MSEVRAIQVANIEIGDGDLLDGLAGFCDCFGDRDSVFLPTDQVEQHLREQLDFHGYLSDSETDLMEAVQSAKAQGFDYLQVGLPKNG